MRAIKKIVTQILLFSFLSLFASCNKKSEVTIGTKTFDTSKNYSVYISDSSESSENDEMRKGFVIELKNLGLVEDINVTYRYENAKGNENYANQIADDFESKKPDLVVTIGDIATKAANEKLQNIPKIFLGVANAEKMGYCDASGNPKFNMTGVKDSHLIDEFLSYVNKNHTEIKSLGVIYSSSNDLAQYDIDFLKFYAMSYDIDIYTVSIKKLEDMDKALNNILPKVEGIVLLQDYLVDSDLTKVINTASRSKKNVFGTTEKHSKAGAEVPILRDYRLVGERGAGLAKQILMDGKKASELKVETVDFKVN